MILMVPISPEVPPSRAPRLWQALLMVLLLGLAFADAYSLISDDTKYVESLQSYVFTNSDGTTGLKSEGQAFLKLRPLLKIAPSKGDWDLKRVFLANFIHGSLVHLCLNLIGIFAGVRICSTFIPFLCTLSIFVLGGSLGLWISILVSKEVSDFIPHVGASAGLFALMGTYYVYNFNYRTRYFFWFPTKSGAISLRTSWFFFVDVLLLEIVLSAGQFFPERIDSVDHIAHVVGFASGLTLALVLRFFQKWPTFLQTRGEFLFWSQLKRPKVFDPIFTPFETWLDILEINPYNDMVKLKLFKAIYYSEDRLDDALISRAFRLLSPTFIRLYTEPIGVVIQRMLARGRPLPLEWLKATPYDSIIRIAKCLSSPPELQPLLYEFVSAYRYAHPEGGDIDRKMEVLMTRLSGIMPSGVAPKTDGKPGNASASNTPR